jgi:hypothetical protein
MNNQSDAYWHNVIVEAHDKYKDAPLGNPYSPFSDARTNVISDVKLVHAMRR